MNICISSNCPITHSGLDFDWHGTTTPSTVLPAGVPTFLSVNVFRRTFCFVAHHYDCHHQWFSPLSGWSFSILPLPLPCLLVSIVNRKEGWDPIWKLFVSSNFYSSSLTQKGDLRQTIYIESEIRLSAWYQVTWDRQLTLKIRWPGRDSGTPKQLPNGRTNVAKRR